MLTITIPATESWDERNERFVYTKEYKLQLEHSLVSLSKWESKWCKPFLSTTELTAEESLDYIKCMTLTQNVPPEVYNYIPASAIEEISAYINAPMTATWFPEDKNKSKKSKRVNNGETVTAELIYYWMIALQIPDKWEKRHLNKLWTLIRVCSAKNAPPKKMNKRELMNSNAALNAARRQKLNTKG